MEVFNELIEYFKDCCKTISKVSEGRIRCKINFPIITFSCVKPVVKFNFEIFDKSKVFIFFEKNGLGRPQFTLFFESSKNFLWSESLKYYKIQKKGLQMVLRNLVFHYIDKVLCTT